MNREIGAFPNGVENLLDDELIDQAAASDALNWISQDDKLQLIPGKLLIGASGVAGKVTGEIFGYRTDGVKVHWRKIGSLIQYFKTANSTWTTTISGLTAAADYSFTNYSSLAGDFTFAIGPDGIFKMNNAAPDSYIALYDSTKNFKGLAFIDKGRMILWNQPSDKTGLYGSHIDPQGSNYTTVTAEALGSGDGVTLTFTPTLAFKATNPLGNMFGLSPQAPVAAATNISAITLAANGQITSAGHGLVAGDRVLFAGIVGTTQLNGLLGTVLNVIDANNFTITTNTSGMTAYSSGGTAQRIEIFTDNFNGTLTSNLGGTGTVNYVSGVVSLTFAVVPITGSSNVTGSYQWENSNAGGVTDFTKSSPRQASEGFVFRQDVGGDSILNVLIGTNGYYSVKSQSTYLLSIGSDDTTADNNVYRAQMGVPSWRGSLSTSIGIIFINTANPGKPELTLLEKNLVDGTLEPKVLFPSFKFANYLYDDCTFFAYDRYILIACKTLNAINNDTLLLCNVSAGTVNITGYAGRTFASDGTLLFMGSSVVQSVFNLFSGFDDDGFAINNYWITKGENFAIKSRGQKYVLIPESLKKYRAIRLRGHITPNQSYGVYASYDDAGWQLVGTVLGSGSYVDYNTPQVIGGNQVGNSQIGGDVLSNVYPYQLSLRMKKMPKFRKRKLKFVALGIGYVDITYEADWDVFIYDLKLPTRFRQKQNVSLDGATENLPNPQF